MSSVANQLLTISYITTDGMPVLANQMVTADKVNRQFDEEFGRKGEKIGATCNVRLPPRYLGTFGAALNVEASTETYVPVPINYQYHVDVQFNTINLELDIDVFRSRFTVPMMATAANRVDSDLSYFMAQNTANNVGTFGTPPTSYLNIATARAILANEGMPKGMTPTVIMNPLAMASMADSLKGVFNPQASISSNYEMGMLAKQTAGFDWFEDPNIPSYTTGTLPGTPVLVGTSTGNASGGTAILTTGWAQTGYLELSGVTASTACVAVGDKITVAGVYPANPQSRGRYGNTLKSFTVLPPNGYAQVTGVATPGGPQFASGSIGGNAQGTFSTTTGLYTSASNTKVSILVGDCMITGGQFQNVSTVTTSGNFTGTPTVTCNGGVASTQSTQNLAFHRDAFALAMVNLPLPRNVEASRATDKELGITYRMLTQYTVNNDAEPTRLDLCYGMAPIYRSLAVVWEG